MKCICLQGFPCGRGVDPTPSDPHRYIDTRFLVYEDCKTAVLMCFASFGIKISDGPTSMAFRTL